MEAKASERNYKTEVLELHVEVRSASKPPWSYVSEVREPGEFVGYRDPRTGKGDGYFKEGKVIGHEVIKNPAQWKFIANLRGRAHTTVICQYCQNQFTYSYTIYKREVFDHPLPDLNLLRPGADLKFMVEPFIHGDWDGEQWKEMNKEQTERWQTYLDMMTRYDPGYPSSHTCPKCGRLQSWMVSITGRNIFYIVTLLSMPIGAILGAANPELVGCQYPCSAYLPLQVIAFLFRIFIGLMLGMFGGMIIGGIVWAILAIGLRLVYLIPTRD